MTKLRALGNIFLCDYIQEYSYHIIQIVEDDGIIFLYLYRGSDGVFNSTTFKFKRP